MEELSCMKQVCSAKQWFEDCCCRGFLRVVTFWVKMGPDNSPVVEYKVRVRDPVAFWKQNVEMSLINKCYPVEYIMLSLTGLCTYVVTSRHRHPFGSSNQDPEKHPRNNKWMEGELCLNTVGAHFQLNQLECHKRKFLGQGYIVPPCSGIESTVL